jgi:hypothetical protein
MTNTSEIARVRSFSRESPSLQVGNNSWQTGGPCSLYFTGCPAIKLEKPKMGMPPEYIAEYRRCNRARVNSGNKECMRKKRLDPDYRNREHAQQLEYRDRKRQDGE